MSISRRTFLGLLLVPALPGFAVAADSKKLDLGKRKSLSPQEAANLQQEVIFLDVRTPKEWQAGHVKGATHIPHYEVARKVSSLIPDRSVPIVTYCEGGGRAKFVVEAMRKQGYTVVPVMKGGFKELIANGLTKE